MLTQWTLTETQLQAIIADAAGTSTDKVTGVTGSAKIDLDLKAANKLQKVLDRHAKPVENPAT